MSVARARARLDRLDRLDRKIYRRLPRRSMRLNAALLALGRVADRWLLWVGVAGALALGDGRFGRRAALRGLLSAAVASVVAKGPAGLLTGRRRSGRAGLARRLPGLSVTSTTSSPSRHSATAFAFATGAAQELPGLAVPVTALAGVVAYSRVHAGAHYPSDAVVGAALGVGAGLVTRRFWPVAPHDPVETGPDLTPASVDPSPEGRGLVVVVNPSAGSGPAPTDELRKALPEAEIVEVDDGSQLEDALREAAPRACALGVSGGDGSVNVAASVAAEHGRPLMVVPGGTLNHFALALGLSSVADAAGAVRDGWAVAVDRGLIAGHTFVNTASIGSYVDLVDARERLEESIGKWPAVVVALYKVLRHAAPVHIEIDGEARAVWMVFVGNCRYHPGGFTPSWRERLDDGQLDIRIVDGNRPWSRVRLIASVLTGRLARCRAYQQRFERRITIRSQEGTLRLARDGETFDGPEEFTIEKAPEPLMVYVPRP
ncbi:MAG: phosphatase PAP2 family protein [Actinomycetota bacterium]|nr:phosphatase PAP2 family protein [Actinomycetota bacterium]